MQACDLDAVADAAVLLPHDDEARGCAAAAGGSQGARLARGVGRKRILKKKWRGGDS
jgi:hypothetical protein